MARGGRIILDKDGKNPRRTKPGDADHASYPGDKGHPHPRHAHPVSAAGGFEAPEGGAVEQGLGQSPVAPAAPAPAEAKTEKGK